MQNVVEEIIPNVQASPMIIIGLLAFVLLLQVAVETLSYIYVYSDEDYQDTAVRCKNMGKKVQALKKNILFGEGVKRRKEEKMIKI